MGEETEALGIEVASGGGALLGVNLGVQDDRSSRRLGVGCLRMHEAVYT